MRLITEKWRRICMIRGALNIARKMVLNFSPKKEKVDWLVCDMVEQPSRISLLIGKWLLNAWCRETIFNLKLPMKKRYQEVILCLENLAVMLAEQNLNFDIQAKHLYHDREEITVHIALKP